ncbi:MAG: hypothetical protein JKY54_19120 [Flavobacteriales bacterium]|nr:hypothetical protein [Flavobacteriales bacterium]
MPIRPITDKTTDPSIGWADDVEETQVNPGDSMSTHTGESSIELLNTAITESAASAAAALVSQNAVADDLAATDADQQQTALDRIQTGQDVTATAADRVQTGLDLTATGTSETNAATSYTNIQAIYLGSKAADPTVDNVGNPLVVGAEYFNTGDNTKRVWTGSAWINMSLSAVGYAELAGAVFTGDVSIESAIPQFIMKDTDTNAEFQISGNSGTGSVTIEVDANSNGTTAANLTYMIRGAQAATLEPTGTGMVSSKALVTREKGDNRYLMLNGSIPMTGALDVAEFGIRYTTANHHWDIVANDVTDFFSFARDDAGAARITAAGTTMNHQFVLATREKGDARWLMQSGGTLTGNLSITGGSVQVLGDIGNLAAQPTYSWGTDTGTGMYNAGGGQIGFSRQGTPTFRIDQSGTDALSALTAMTREKADARYSQQSTHVQATNGYLSLPSGLLVQWGQTVAPNNGTSAAATYPIVFPNNVFWIIGGNSVANPGATNGMAVGARLDTLSTHKVYSNDASRSVFWLAIGN